MNTKEMTTSRQMPIAMEKPTETDRKAERFRQAQIQETRVENLAASHIGLTNMLF
jgi:hypothetical protein